VKRIPKIDDYRLAQSVARLKRHPDGIVFIGFLAGDVKEHNTSTMRNAKEDSEMRNGQGALQLLEDLRELFDKADTWAANLDLQAKKNASQS